MAHHSNLKVIFTTESDRWFLHEEGSPLIQQEPWNSWLYFDVTDIRITSTFKVDDRFASHKERISAFQKEVIVATLIPEKFSSEKYSLFGTELPLSDIQLFIDTVEDDQEEFCFAEGHDGYVAGGKGDWTKHPESKNKTLSFTLSFNLHIQKSRFARYASLVREKALNGASFSVGEVEGFYSWRFLGMSPDIIKVLPRGLNHMVQMPEKCGIEPPRLGKIGKFELKISSFLEFTDSLEIDIDESSKNGETNSGNLVNMVALDDPKVLGLLNSIRVALWIILLFLAFILIFKR